MRTVNLIVKGKVQGVFFRASAKQTADKAGITGWVKNRHDGNVEIMANGTEEAIQSFIAWCRKGPARAEVAEVIITPVQMEDLGSFEIKR